MLPGSTRFVTSPFAPLVGLPTKVTSVADSKKRQVCSDWLIANSLISITTLPVRQLLLERVRRRVARIVEAEPALQWATEERRSDARFRREPRRERPRR